ncbi:hypothetical protein BDK92_2031 [Micromonospora pisi]|uniref:Uncharacterized protein n=1 Tax=Micromonospora pisi TaxID=589240 RepID=A0A495JI59_9ACTN|nr:hypothetical protein BDK92_2031 [Micromonospora pisi]
MSGSSRLRLPGQIRAIRRARVAQDVSYPNLSESPDVAVPVVVGDIAASYPGLVAEVCADLDGASRAEHPTVRVYPRLLEPVVESTVADDERVRPLYSRVLRLHHVDPGGLLCFLFFEGTVALGLLLALAELVNWWGVLVLPMTVAVMVKMNDLVAAAVVRSAARVPDLEQERFRREMLPAVGRARVPEEWKISPDTQGGPPGAGSAGHEQRRVTGTAGASRSVPGDPRVGTAAAAEALPTAARVVLGRAAANRLRANSGHAGTRRTPIGRPANAQPAAGERTEQQWQGQQTGRWSEQPDAAQRRASQSGTRHYE